MIEVTCWKCLNLVHCIHIAWGQRREIWIAADSCSLSKVGGKQIQLLELELLVSLNGYFAVCFTAIWIRASHFWLCCSGECRVRRTKSPICMQTLSCGLLGTPLEEMLEWESFPASFKTINIANFVLFLFYIKNALSYSAIPSSMCLPHFSLFSKCSS